MKKILLSIGIVLIIAGAYILTTKKSPAPIKEVTQVKSVTENKSFFDLVNDGKSYQCNYSMPSTNGNTSVGKVYISEGKIRDESKSKIGNTELETLFIVRDGYVYVWTSLNRSSAFKTKVTPTVEGKPALPANTFYLENKETINPSLYQCQTWTPDESLFELSKDIKIVESPTKTTTVPKVNTPPQVEVKPQEPVVAPVPPGPNTFTMSDIALHSDRTSCYTTIAGKVYDVTSYIDKHKGGASKILKICGKDGSSLFEDQHGGEMKPEQMLATFEIGILSK